MCRKIWNENKRPLRSQICDLKTGDVLIINNKPMKRPISSIRVTASNVSTDLDRNYSVNKKKGNIVVVTRNS